MLLYMLTQTFYVIFSYYKTKDNAIKTPEPNNFANRKTKVI